MSEFLLKCWDVTVVGYAPVRIVAASRGKALAQAWRNDIFNGLTFGEFLKVAKARAARLIPVDFGQLILVLGRPAYRVGMRGQYVSFVRPNETAIFLSHTDDVSEAITI